MRKVLIFFIALFPLLSLAGEENILLEWEGREKYTYQIELKKFGTTLFIERLSEPRLALDLSPGDYTYQVTFYNKFDKADARSDWITLTILKDLEPQIIEVPEHSLFGRDKMQRLEILTVDIMDDARIRLEREGREYPLDYLRSGSNSLELFIDSSRLDPGLYDLRIINPSGSETHLKNAVELKEKVHPHITGLEPSRAFLGEQLPRVSLKGEHLDKDVVAFLERDGERHRLPLSDYRGENEISLWFDLTGLEAGMYDLVLINPPLEETVATDAFTIIDPRKVRDDAYYDRLRWGTDLLINIPLLDVLFDTPVTNFTYVEKEGFFGPLPEMEFLLRLDMTRDHFFWKYFGGTFRVAFFPPFMDDYYFTTMNMGIYGRTRFHFPVNFFMEGLLGYRWMSLESEGSTISEEGSLLTWGGGIIFNYDRILFESSLRSDFWLLTGDYDVSLVQLSFRLGYRF